MTLWYLDVADAVTAANCTFFHAGALRRTSKFSEDLPRSLEARGLTAFLVDCQAVAEDGWHVHFSHLRYQPPGTVIILWRPEAFGGRRDFQELLRQVRPTIQEELVVLPGITGV